jgi:hypothetical protein
VSEAPGDGAPPRRDLVRRLAVVGIAAGAVLACVGVRVAMPRDPAWFAYAPLSDTVFVPTGPGAWLAPTLVGAGTLAIGLGAGYLAGRRRRD